VVGCPIGGEDKIGSLGLRPSWGVPAEPLPIKAATVPAGAVVFSCRHPSSSELAMVTNKKKRL